MYLYRRGRTEQVAAGQQARARNLSVRAPAARDGSELFATYPAGQICEAHACIATAFFRKFQNS